ncbi:hypothetical protein GCM10020254_87390 [Streptomyces goshikiensis]
MNRDAQVAVRVGVDGGDLDPAPPVLVFGVEDAQVDERGERGRVAGRGELQQGLGGRADAFRPLPLLPLPSSLTGL